MIGSVTDGELLASADPEDFGRFYERHVDALTAFVGRRVRAHDAVFDVVAETFARALARRGQFDPARGPAIAWLQGIARNLIVDAARRDRVAADVHGTVGGLGSPVPAVACDIDATETIDGEGLRDGLAALPPEQREALLRRFVLEQSYPQIAAEQRVSEQVARKRVSRGRAALRAYVSIAATVIVALAVVAVALIAGGGNGGSQPLHAGDRGQLTWLIDHYAFLRRAQTPPDRVPFYNVLGRSASDRVTDVPALTRALSVGGVDLTVYVVRIAGPASGHPGPASGHPGPGRPLPGYWLAVEASQGSEGIGSLVESGAGEHYPFVDVNLGTDRLRLAVVPDGVAAVSWTWPREFDPLALRYRPALTVTREVEDNIAVARVDRAVAPHAVTWIAPNAKVVYRTTEGPSAGDTNDIEAASGSTRDEPRLFAAAQRNPATPNPVVVVPDSIRVGATPNVMFRALLTNATYLLHMSGPCAGTPSVASEPLYEPVRRGQVFTFSAPNVPTPRCAGRYTVDVKAVLGPRIYRPFGSATFTVR